MIQFDAENHKYYNGLDELISVTTLLKKHGLAPDYSAVNRDVLQTAADKGTDIHAVVSNFIDFGEADEDSPYAEHLRKFAYAVVAEGLEFENSEIILGNDITAGTADLISDEYLADIKTGQTIDKDYCKWQLSIYDYLAGPGRKLHIIHLTDEFCKIIPVQPVPVFEIERLLECERKGIPYIRAEVPAEIMDAGTDIAIRYFQAEDLLKAIEEEMAEWKQTTLEAMERNAIKKYENETISITYVAPTSRTSVDSKKLKDSFPDVYDTCTKTSNIKASLRITRKNNA